MSDNLEPDTSDILYERVVHDIPANAGNTSFVFPDEVNENAYNFDNKRPDEKISGRGPQGHELCHEFNQGYHSGAHGTHTDYHCVEQGCPECYTYWAGKLAAKSAAFLFSQASLYPVYHITLRPAEGYFPGWKNLARMLRAFIHRFHQTNRDPGWCYTFHPRSFVCSVCGASREHYKHEPCPGCTLLAGHPVYSEPFWKWNPHVHAITNFWYSGGKKHRARQIRIDRWLTEHHVVFVNLTAKNHNPILSQEHMQGVVKYELSHARYKERQPGQGKGEKALVWVGAWHPNHLKRWYPVEKSDVLDATIGTAFNAVASEPTTSGPKTIGWKCKLDAGGQPIKLDRPNLAKAKIGVCFDMSLKPVKVVPSRYETRGTVPVIEINRHDWFKRYAEMHEETIAKLRVLPPKEKLSSRVLDGIELCDMILARPLPDIKRRVRHKHLSKAKKPI